MKSPSFYVCEVEKNGLCIILWSMHKLHFNLVAGGGGTPSMGGCEMTNWSEKLKFK